MGKVGGLTTTLLFLGVVFVRRSKKEIEWYRAYAVYLALREYMPASAITKRLQKKGLSKSAAYRILKGLEEDGALIRVGSWNKVYNQGPRAKKYLSLAKELNVMESEPPVNGKTRIGGEAPGPAERKRPVGRVVLHHIGFKFQVRRWVKDPGQVPFELDRSWKSGRYGGWRWRVPVEGVGEVLVTVQEGKRGLTGYFYLPPLRADLVDWKEELRQQEALAWSVLRAFCPRAGVEAGLLQRMDGLEGAVKISHNPVGNKMYVKSQIGETWVDNTSGDGEVGTFLETRGEDMISALLDAPHRLVELERAVTLLGRVVENQTKLLNQVTELQYRVIELLSPRRDYDDGGVMFG